MTRAFANDAGDWDFPYRPTVQWVWWFPEWCGLGLFRWEGASACMFRPSILLGFVEMRRWRAKDETERLFDAFRKRLAEEDAADVSATRRAKTPKAVECEASQSGAAKTAQRPDAGSSDKERE